MPPLADRQRHRLVHLLFRNGCTFLPDRSWTRGKPPEAREKRDHGTAILAGLNTFLGPAEDMLELLALRGRVGSDRGSRGHRERTRGSSCQDHHQVPGSVGLERTVRVADGEPPSQALMTVVMLARKEDTVVTGKTRYDTKYKELVENAHQLGQGLLRAWEASMEKRYGRR